MIFHARLSLPPTHALRPIIPDNARPLCITAAAGTQLAGAFSFGTVKYYSFPSNTFLPQITEFYIPKNFIIHAALLGQTFVHCRKFPTAASRRSLGRVSVPVWLFCLSAQLCIVALVSHYLTNQLMHRKTIFKHSRKGLFNMQGCPSILHPVLATVSSSYPRLEGRFLTCYSPVRHQVPKNLVRLACIRHAASVNPEPGSNSQ